MSPDPTGVGPSTSSTRGHHAAARDQSVMRNHTSSIGRAMVTDRSNAVLGLGSGSDMSTGYCLRPGATYDLRTMSPPAVGESDEGVKAPLRSGGVWTVKGAQ